VFKHDLRPGESIQIGETTVTLVRKSSQVASLLIDAPRDVKITTNREQKAEKETKGVTHS